MHDRILFVPAYPLYASSILSFFMKRIYFLLLCLLLTMYSCGRAKPDNAALLKKAYTQLKDQKPSPGNMDSLLGAWLALNKEAVSLQDTLYRAKVNYHLARLYAMAQKDSSRWYIDQALELIDNTEQNWPEKAMIYNGMGNVYHGEGKFYQSHYYFNRAASIVLAEKNMDLDTSARITILLSAAQSNEQNYQYKLAYTMNAEAIKLLPGIAPDNLNHQRAYVQLLHSAQRLDTNLSEAPVYIARIEALEQQFPGKFDPHFLYDCKIQYFDQTGQKDSVVHYVLLNLAIDEAKAAAAPEEETVMNNLFMTYSNLGNVYTRQEKYTLAGSYFEKATNLLATYKTKITTNSLMLYTRQYAEYCKRTGQKDKSIQLLESLAELKEQTFENENLQAVSEMNALHQIRSKDIFIRSLNENLKTKQWQLQQNRLMMIIGALCILLLLLLGGVLYFIFRQRKAKEEKAKVQLQQQLLRTQMEPHFIFNTLAALQSFIRLDKKEQALKYLSRFSRLLRSNLELSRENLVPLTDEIDALENYLSLQQMRHEPPFHYAIDVQPAHDLESVMIPPMLIQPFVENALIHGIDLGEKSGEVIVQLELKQNILWVTIADSGKKKADHALSNGTSLSGAITRERMSLMGKDAAISSLPNAAGGTTVTLQIPVQL